MRFRSVPIGSKPTSTTSPAPNGRAARRRCRENVTAEEARVSLNVVDAAAPSRAGRLELVRRDDGRPERDREVVRLRAAQPRRAPVVHQA